MVGDEQTRYCGLCKLNVFNLSGMSEEEAVQLVQRKEGSLCVRFYKRIDGTLITQDCPVGLRKAAIRMKVRIGMVISAIAAGFGLEKLYRPEPLIMGEMMCDVDVSKNSVMGKIRIMPEEKKD